MPGWLRPGALSLRILRGGDSGREQARDFGGELGIRLQRFAEKREQQVAVIGVGGGGGGLGGLFHCAGRSLVLREPYIESSRAVLKSRAG